jgi:sugar phosphate isomerase/epimerase
MNVTRRDLGRLALATLPAGRLLAKPDSKPDSKFGGVQVGINAPYSFRGMPGKAEDIMKYMLQLGLNGIELRSQPVEGWLGAPAVPAAPGRNRPPLTPEQDAERKKAIEELQKWRLALSTGRMKEFRKYYEDAGIPIEIVKFDGINTLPDDVVDYCFTLARTLGARAISCEIPVSQTKKLGQFAEKHKTLVAYHGHGNVTDPEAFGRPESWETAMSFSKYNGCNVDIGHFVAGNGYAPIDFIRKYHDRISHIHVKDRKKNQGPNMVWGQGDTPIKEVLQMLKKEKYNIQATIEFEYPTPEGSDVLTEIGKCVQFCKEALS